jgi:hypothetical protein
MKELNRVELLKIKGGEETTNNQNTNIGVPGHSIA